MGSASVSERRADPVLQAGDLATVTRLESPPARAAAGVGREPGDVGAGKDIGV